MIFELPEYKENTIVMVWKYTETCNMSCSYCDIDNSAKINKKNYNKIIQNKIDKESKKNKHIKFIVDVEGGEPTLDSTVYDLQFEDNVELTLFTNFFKPDINKLIQFSIKNKIVISANINEFNYELFAKNLKELRSKSDDLSNIMVSVLVTKKTNYLDCKKMIDYMINLNIPYVLAAAEDFNHIKNDIIDDENLRNIITEHNPISRIKWSCKGYTCNNKFLKVTCSSLSAQTCAGNAGFNIMTWDSNKYLTNNEICNSWLCGVHDYQLHFKKEKII